MKLTYLIPAVILSTSCIQNTYQYPDCDSGDGAIEDVSDIPSPSSDIGEDQGNDNSDSTDTTSTEPEGPVNYFFDNAQSLLYVQVYKDPSAAASGFAHNHVMRATNWGGSVQYDVSDLDECEMSFSLPVTSLAVDEDAMRELVGYGDVISSSDRSTIRGHMLESNQLNADQYDSIWFESSSCTKVNSGLVVNGEMFIAGTATEISIDMNTTLSSDKFYMSGVIDLTHSDFNMTPYEAFFGAVRNAEPLTITFDMVGFAG